MPRIHTLDMSRLTPLGQLIAEYMRAQWPRLQTKAELAHLVGVRPTTIDNLLYSQHAASTRTLNKIARATGIPADRLYNAASGSYAPASAPLSPPQPLVETPAPRQSRRANATQPTHDPVYAALRQFLRQLRHTPMDEATLQAIIDSYVESLQPLYPDLPSRPIIAAWREQIWQEEHDHNYIETLPLPAVTPAAREANEASQQESQAVGCDV